MNLHSYFQLPSALTVSELRERIGAKSDAQIRQWQHGYADRRPSPENCLSIERATDGMVTRQDLRPDDYWLIWPDLSDPGLAIHAASPQEVAPQPAPDKEKMDHLMAEAAQAGLIERRSVIRRAVDRARLAVAATEGA